MDGSADEFIKRLKETVTFFENLKNSSKSKKEYDIIFKQKMEEVNQIFAANVTIHKLLQCPIGVSFFYSKC